MLQTIKTLRKFPSMSENSCLSNTTADSKSHEERARALLAKMTLAEKTGQMTQVNGGTHELHNAVREGRIGSVINEVYVEEVNE